LVNVLRAMAPVHRQERSRQTQVEGKDYEPIVDPSWGIILEGEYAAWQNRADQDQAPDGSKLWSAVHRRSSTMAVSGASRSQKPRAARR